MTNEFSPIYQMPIERYTTRIRSLLDEDARLETEVVALLKQQRGMDSSLKGTKRKKQKFNLDQKMAKGNQRRREIKAELDLLNKELAARMEAPTVEPFADELPQTFNECVGSCYGICVYISNTGEILYRDIEPGEAEAVGESYAATAELRPFDELDPARQTLIHNYLRTNFQTPFWAKSIYFKEEKHHENPPY